MVCFNQARDNLDCALRAELVVISDYGDFSAVDSPGVINLLDS